MCDTQKKIMSVAVALLLAFVLGSCRGDAQAPISPAQSPPASDTSPLLPEAWVKAAGGNVNEINTKINEDGEALVHLAAKEGRVDVLILVEGTRCGCQRQKKV